MFITLHNTGFFTVRIIKNVQKLAKCIKKSDKLWKFLLSSLYLPLHKHRQKSNITGIFSLECSMIRKWHKRLDF